MQTSTGLTVTTPNLSETVLGATEQQWMGSLREEYDSIDSTQLRAVDLLRNGVIGAVVTSRKQTEGRGRMGRSFWSPDSIGLYVSVTLPPPKIKERFPLLSLWAGVTTLRAVREGGVILSSIPINLTKRLSLKWPNDVLLDGRKLAGILLTGVSAGSDMVGAVLGIGINLNVDKTQFPEEIRSTATSIKMATGHEWDRLLFLSHLLTVIERMWNQLNEPPDQLLAEWLRWGPQIGQSLSVRDIDKYLEGKFAGLTCSGELVLELADGSKRNIMSGIVEYLEFE